MQSANSIARVVEPEWLDRLPTNNRLAVRSRLDLRRVNRIMGHPMIIYRPIRCRMKNGVWDLSEIGAGDGALALRIVSYFKPDRRPRCITLVDRVSLVEAGTLRAICDLGTAASGVQADAFDWLKSGPSTSVIFANLFLHHFSNVRLKELLALVAQRCTTFVACEPKRSTFAHLATRFLGFIGCNEVTRHDAVVSVRAGFAQKELSRLWPGSEQWQLEEHSAGLFSHLFVAHRAP